MQISRLARLSIVTFVFSLLIFVGGHHPEFHIAHSQDGGDDEACTALIDDALATIGSACAEIGNNEACYGNVLVAATLDEESEARFDDSGDIVNLNDLQAVFTQPANPDDGTWGLALLTVQADLPIYSGTSVTYVLFGDAQIHEASTVLDSVDSPPPFTCDIENSRASNINMRGGPSTNDSIVNVFNSGEMAVADGRNEAGDWVHVEYGETNGWLYAPLIDTACDIPSLAVVDPNEMDSSSTQPTYTYMQAISLESGNSEACDRSPDGLLVRSPEGRRVRIVVNGVELTMSSAGFITAQADGDLVIQGLEGSIDVTSGGQTETVTDGVFTTVPLDGLQADGPPTSPQPIDPNTELPALDTANAALVSSNIGLPRCTLTSGSTHALRAGPNEQFPISYEIPSNVPIAVYETYVDGETTYYRVAGNGWINVSNPTFSSNCPRLPDIVADAEGLPSSGTWSMKVTLIQGDCPDPPAGPEDPNFRFRLILTFSEDRSTMGYDDGLPTGTQTYTRVDDVTYINNTYGAARLVFTSPTTFIETFSTGNDPCSFRSIDDGFYVGP